MDTKSKEPIYKTVSELSNGGTAEIMRTVSEDNKTVIITRQGKPQAVIISFDKYNKVKYERGIDI